MWRSVATRATKKCNVWGIRNDFWNLCYTGNRQGLRTIFRGRWPTYRGFTLEFLSTINKIKRSRGRYRPEVERFEFRLGNEDRVLTVAEFDIVFDTEMQGGIETHCDFNEFWSLITLEQGGFESGTSKSSAIRNPVLRYLHRAISNVIFVRSDSGSLNNNELYCLFSLLRGHDPRLHQYMGEYWKRVAKGSSGLICCRGLMTALCAHFGVVLNEDDALPGEMYLTYEGLFHMDMIKTDQNQHAYCPQLKADDHFPMPSPDLTKVDSWENQANWKMNSPAHHRVIAALPWQVKKKPIGGPFLDPGDMAGGSGAAHMDEDEEDEDEEDEDKEEEEEHNEGGHGGAHVSQPLQI